MQKPSTDTRATSSSTTSRSAAAPSMSSCWASSRSFTCASRDSTVARTDSGLRRERLDHAHGEAVRREPPGHVVEQRPEPADVGMQHDARRRHAVGPGVHGRDLEPVDDERRRLDGDVVDGTFTQCCHAAGSYREPRTSRSRERQA